MKKLIFILVVVALAMSGCKLLSEVKSHSSATLTTPKTLTDPITLVFKIWGVADMAASLVPPNSKFGKFVVETGEYCTINITQFPKDKNDTTAITIKCQNDSLTKLVASRLGL